MRPGWVWAPKAQRVELVLVDRARHKRVLLEPHTHSWWGSDEFLEPGTQYGFSLDGGPVLPDPRAQFQPRGLPGPSEVIDHASFFWSGRDYAPPSLAQAVFYELHVGTFSARGDYGGVTERLDHLQGLGITHLELMPLHQFPGRRGWGYDSVQLYAPYHGYGRPEGLKQLVDGCHSRGIGVILDVVYNHVGPDENTLDQFGPYLRQTRTPWGHGFNLDGRRSAEVRRFILDNARMWLEDYRFDGLRLDAVQSIEDSSDPHLLDELAGQAQRLGAELGRPIWLFAEAEARRPQLTLPREQQGRALHAQWDDDLHYALVGSLSGAREGHYGRARGLAKLAKALGGHPLRRVLGPQKKLPVPPDRLITYVQNHDRIGNRPDAQRFVAYAGIELDRLAALLLFTCPLRPLLFMGQEWGASTPFYYFVDHQRADLVRSVRRGRAREMKSFGWKTTCPITPESPRAFDASALDWSELDAPRHQEVLRYYTRLIELRREFDELTEPAAVTLDETSHRLGLRRKRTRVFANLGKGPGRFRSEPGSRLLLSSRPGVVLERHYTELPALTACLVLRGQPGQGPRGGTKRRRRS